MSGGLGLAGWAWGVESGELGLACLPDKFRWHEAETRLRMGLQEGDTEPPASVPCFAASAKDPHIDVG